MACESLLEGLSLSLLQGRPLFYCFTASEESSFHVLPLPPSLFPVQRITDSFLPIQRGVTFFALLRLARCAGTDRDGCYYFMEWVRRCRCRLRGRSSHTYSLLRLLQDASSPSSSVEEVRLRVPNTVYNNLTASRLHQKGRRSAGWVAVRVVEVEDGSDTSLTRLEAGVVLVVQTLVSDSTREALLDHGVWILDRVGKANWETWTREMELPPYPDLHTALRYTAPRCRYKMRKVSGSVFVCLRPLSSFSSDFTPSPAESVTPSTASPLSLLTEEPYKKVFAFLTLYLVCVLTTYQRVGEGISLSQLSSAVEEYVLSELFLSHLLSMIGERCY